MDKIEIIEELELLKREIEWEYSLTYQIAIDDAIDIIKEVMEREQQGEDNKDSGV